MKSTLLILLTLFWTISFGLSDDKVYIEAGGKVGVGLPTPTEKLDVDGRVRSDGYVVHSEVVSTATHTAGSKSMLLVDTSTQGVEITLPDASASAGRIYEVKMLSASNYVDIVDTADQLIDTMTGLKLTAVSGPLPYVRLAAANGKWNILNEHDTVGFDNSYSSTKGFEFNGTDEYIEIYKNKEDMIPNTAEWTYMAWVKTNSAATSMSVIGGRWGSAHYTGRLNLTQTQIHFSFNDTAGAEINTLVNADVIDDNWHFIMVVSDGTDVLFYVDGVEVTDGSTGAGKGGQMKQWTGLGYLNLGRQHYYGTAYFEGIIDEVSCTEGDLSSQASYFWNGGKPRDMANQSGLLFYYRFGEDGDNMTAADGVVEVGPNNLSGTAKNMDATDLVDVTH